MLLLAICAFAWPTDVPGQEVETLAIGASAPAFSLPGVDDRTYSLSDFEDAKLLVMVFTCNHCPTAQAYEQRIIEFEKKYREQGVTLVAVSPNDPLAVRLDELGYSDLGDSLEDMKLRAKECDFQFPYLYDGDTQEMSRAYGVRATPHTFVFDQERKLRYVGRIDNSEVKTVTSRDLENAVDALLAGDPVPVEKTRVFGCSTKWSDKRENAEQSIIKWDQEPVSISKLSPHGAEKLVSNDSDKYLLVNVWATWCGPCIEELPQFVTINRMYRNRDFELITISADDPALAEDVLKVLREKKVAARNFIFDSDDRDELFDAVDPEWEGALPFTILVAPGGEVVFRKHGTIEPLELKRAIVEKLGRTYANR